MSHTILLADDNLFIRQGLCELFEQEADFYVCGDAENGKEAVEKAKRLHPDLILLDLSLDATDERPGRDPSFEAPDA